MKKLLELYFRLNKKSSLRSKPESWITLIDEISSFIKKSKETISSQDILSLEILMSDLLWKIGRLEDGKSRINSIIEVINKNNLEEIKGDAFYFQGEIYYIEEFLMGINADSETIHRESLRLRENQGDKHGMTHSLSRIGVILERKGKWDEAMKYYQNTIELSDEIRYDEGKTRPLTHIGAFKLRNGDIDSALDDFRFCFKIHNETKNYEMLMFSLCNLANAIHKKENKINNCIKLLRDALTIAEKTQFQLGIMRVHQVFASLFTEEGNKNEALKHYNLLANLAQKNNYISYLKLAETSINDLKNASSR